METAQHPDQAEPHSPKLPVLGEDYRWPRLGSACRGHFYLERVMHSSPPSAPHGPQQDTYFVLEDFGPRGRCWRASDEEDTDRDENSQQNLLIGFFRVHARGATLVGALHKSQFQ